MNFKVFISVNIHTVALSWSSRERDHPAPAARSMLHLVWHTLDIHKPFMRCQPEIFRTAMMRQEWQAAIDCFIACDDLSDEDFLGDGTLEKKCFQ
jgi:hypothetical protein